MRHRFLNWRYQANALIEPGMSRSKRRLRVTDLIKRFEEVCRAAGRIRRGDDSRSIRLSVQLLISTGDMEFAGRFGNARSLMAPD